jgi:hypothetical protein
VSRVVVAASFACNAERLARVSSANNIGSFDRVPVDFFDVPMIWHLRPVFPQNTASVIVYL